MEKMMTVREKQVFKLLLENNTTEDIAADLEISAKTVRNHIAHVMDKIGAKSRTFAILELIRLGELQIKKY